MESKLWQRINRDIISLDRLKNLSNFRSSDINYKIALWNPETNGVRYLKTLIYNLVSSFTDKEALILKNIEDITFGNPITIKYNGKEVCLDYAKASMEIAFIDKVMYLQERSILEIGAGYGRTCHTVLSNFDIKSYTIIDLTNCLNLSFRYLKEVLKPELFKKIIFCDANEIKKVDQNEYDLCININSLSEMNSEVVSFYKKFIDKHCSYFYNNNPVGKYLDRTLDNHSQGSNLVKTALSTGVIRDVIDIHDSQEVHRAVKNFIRVYRPSSKWVRVADSWARPWSYYWQVLFSLQKENSLPLGKGSSHKK